MATETTIKEESVRALPGTSSSYGYGANVSSTYHLTAKEIKPVTDFAKVMDEPDASAFMNITAPLDQGEKLSYTCKKLDRVTSTQELAFPYPNRTGVQYTIKLEEILRTIRTSDSTIIGDEPVVMYLTIRHQNSGNIDNSKIKDVLARLLGACMKDAPTTEDPAAWTWRFEDLMRSALVPTKDLSN